ncbi:MAG: YabP/YqfC family sporulation protein [Oscillospiraceae bacterium]|nr:YabP/YqfC family sporulation protein [Oscillospiraceae bacterium]
MEKRKLAQLGLEAVDRLDLPGELAAGVPQMELVGNRQFFMSQHKGVLVYSTETIEIAGGTLLVRLLGRELQLQAMTETELRIGGYIEKMELIC